MINKGILQSNLTNKFTLLALHSIVNECFINGLPLNQSEITNDEKRALTKYSYNVLNQIGGLRALESTFNNPNYTMKQKMLVYDIYDISHEIATEAAKRIVSETNTKDPNNKLNEIVDRAAFTDAEYKKFASKAEKLDLDSISDIIKEKTINVLKDEQEQYEKEESLENELKDALAQSKDFANVTTESYMDIVLTKADARHHVSLFSKLQEAAYEMTLNTPIKNGTDIFPIVEKVTFEAFLEPLKKITSYLDIDKCYESYVANESDVTMYPMHEQMRPKLSSLVSIIVYTIMETLKTLNLYSPSQDCIKKFVCSTASQDKVNSMKAFDVYNKAIEMLKEANCTDCSKVETSHLSNTLVEMKKIGDILESFIANGVEGVESEQVTLTLDKLHTQMDRIETVLNEKAVMTREKAIESSTTTYYGELQKQNDIAQFNKISNLFSRNPLVSEIRLKVNPNHMQSIIDVDVANESGQVIKSSFMNMQVAVESSKYLDYLNETFKKSKLADTSKCVCIVMNDGSGKKIILD